MNIYSLDMVIHLLLCFLVVPCVHIYVHFYLNRFTHFTQHYTKPVVDNTSHILYIDIQFFSFFL